MMWPFRVIRAAARADDPAIMPPCAALTQTADPDVALIPAFKASYAPLFAEVLAAGSLGSGLACYQPIPTVVTTRN